MRGHRAVINSLPLQCDEYDPRATTWGSHAINMVMHFHQFTGHTGIICTAKGIKLHRDEHFVLAVFYVTHTKTQLNMGVTFMEISPIGVHRHFMHQSIMVRLH